jgi:hypothetical protein
LVGDGGSGRRNRLIAVASASTLIGGNEDDILIAGTTLSDMLPDLALLKAIRAYSGTADAYATRMVNLTAGNGVPLLDATTVTGNGGSNTLNGTGELAWVFTGGADNIGNFDPNSQYVIITP